MRSFDFYDTVVTRLVAEPTDIFSLVGERIGVPEFRSLRIAAEATARASINREVSLRQIYDYLSLDANTKDRARRLELQLEEELIAPVTAVLSQVRTGDFIVSDMYHDESLFRNMLKRFAPSIVPGRVIVSSAVGTSKASGGIWKMLAAEYPSHEWHIGDNPVADVRRVRACGLKARHFTGAMLNPYEARLAKDGKDGSLIAGASRAARLSIMQRTTLPPETAAIEAFASVFCPILHAFVSWIVSTCESEGIKDVYFLARDGQLPFKIALTLAQERRQDTRVHYVYASRHALHLPGCSSIDGAESWLLDNTPHLSLRTIAERAAVPVEIVVSAAQPRLGCSPDENIPPAKRTRLREVIRDASFVDAFTASVDHAFGPAASYYLRQGLGTGERVALVDIGWNGRLQRSLGSLMEKASKQPTQILGLYLCLSRRAAALPGHQLRGFMADPERAQLAAFFDGYRHILEAAFSADHPSTVGFHFVGGDAQPVFGAPYTKTVHQRIALHHAVCEAFAQNVATLERAAGRPLIPSTSQAVKNLQLFLSQPRRNDGLAFIGFPFVGNQTGDEAKPICKYVTPADLLSDGRDRGYWREGSFSASGLSLVNALRRIVQRRRPDRLIST
jgi:hypothetical protein